VSTIRTNLFPYTTLFRTEIALRLLDHYLVEREVGEIAQISSAVLESFLTSRPRTTVRSYNHLVGVLRRLFHWLVAQQRLTHSPRSEEHTSELQSRFDLVC